MFANIHSNLSCWPSWELQSDLTFFTDKTADVFRRLENLLTSLLLFTVTFEITWLCGSCVTKIIRVFSSSQICSKDRSLYCDFIKIYFFILLTNAAYLFCMATSVLFAKTESFTSLNWAFFSCITLRSVYFWVCDCDKCQLFSISDSICCRNFSDTD